MMGWQVTCIGPCIRKEQRIYEVRLAGLVDVSTRVPAGGGEERKRGGGGRVQYG